MATRCRCTGRGEELQFDPEAYNYLRGFSIGWPCLSFDVVRDELGLVRSEFPHTLYGIAGTQAEKASWNYVGIFKLSNINGKKREPIPASAVDGDMGSDSSSDEDDEEYKAHYTVKKGSSCGIYKPDTLNESKSTYMCYLGRHWSCSDDCNKCIHLWEPASGNWDVDTNTKPFVGHFASVEDLQWNLTENDVFASCSVDGTIAIWDIHKGREPCYHPVKVHKSDVNVISWNPHACELFHSFRL